MQINHVDTRWFQNALADKRLSQRKLAIRLGVDPAAVSLMIRGKRKMSAAEAAEVAKFLGVSVEEVLWKSGNTATMPAKEKPPSFRPPVPQNTAGLQNAMFDVPVPMADGSLATLSIPRELTKADAERISALVSALARG